MQSGLQRRGGRAGGCARPRGATGACPPEQIAQIVTAKLKSPVAQPDKAELSLKVVLPRAVIERLMARAHRENSPSLAAWVQAVLEREGRPEAEGRRRTGG